MGTSDHLITTMEQLEALYGAKNPNSIVKEIDHLSDGYRKLIEAAPFVAIATGGPDGFDCSPKGDAPGFVRILDDKTLAIPDRPGNNRLDGFRNILRDPRIALLFLIPGVGETFRVNGRASISIDPELMQSFAVNGKLPRSVLIVHIETAFFHCSKAIVRSKLWDPSDQDRPQEPAVDRHHHRGTEPGQTRRRDLRPRGAGADQGAALLMFVPVPPASPLSISRICAGTGAVTATGGLFLEIGTTISRECRCSGGAASCAARGHRYCRRQSASPSRRNARATDASARSAARARARSGLRRAPSPSRSSTTACRSGRASSTSRGLRRACRAAMSMRPSSASGAPSTTAQ